MLRTALSLAACALLLAAAPGAAVAQSKSDEAKERERINKLRAQVRSYRCVTKGGRKYYGSTVPPQCTGELVEALSATGLVLFRIEPPLTPEQKAAKEAEEKKAAEAEEARREAARQAELQARRDRALLQTYADVSDIDRVRGRALAANREAASQVEQRIAQLKQRQEQLAKQAGKDPEKHAQDVKAVAYDLSLQEQLLESRKREAAEINARYDEEKRKYLQLTGGK
jgi:type IV secretory pathway VirB10-like protein